MLQDNFGRRFHYLRPSIIDLCNFRCNYCLPGGNACDSPRDFLNLTEISTLVAAFALLGTSKVRITGGEPALRKDLAERIRRCKNTPGIEKVALTTNGFSLVGQIDELKEAGT
jgi:cyclic pyranopterin phosphate synthase